MSVIKIGQPSSNASYTHKVAININVDAQSVTCTSVSIESCQQRERIYTYRYDVLVITHYKCLSFVTNIRQLVPCPICGTGKKQDVEELNKSTFFRIFPRLCSQIDAVLPRRTFLIFDAIRHSPTTGAGARLLLSRTHIVMIVILDEVRTFHVIRNGLTAVIIKQFDACVVVVNWFHFNVNMHSFEVLRFNTDRYRLAELFHQPVTQWMNNEYLANVYWRFVEYICNQHCINKLLIQTV